MCVDAMAVNLDGFQIRYPEFPRELWESTTPYSDLMQIKKDRRNPAHTKRPLNAFMLFAKIQRDSLTPNLSCNHCEISKALGKLWQSLTEEEKEPFIRGGKTLVELHRLEFPDYKYRPRKKEEIKEAQTKPVVKKTVGRKRPAKTILQARVGHTIKSEPMMLENDTQKLLHTSPMSWDQFYFSNGSLVTPPASPPSDQLYFNTTASAVHPTNPNSDLIYYNTESPAAAPTSPLSCQGGLGSPASHLHTPYSPVSSIGSSSGYESEALSHSGLLTTTSSLEDMRSQEDWSPLSEPEMAQELQDLEVTPLDETALLNPLAMFPALDLSGDELDDLGFGL